MSKAVWYWVWINRPATGFGVAGIIYAHTFAAATIIADQVYPGWFFLGECPPQFVVLESARMKDDTV